MQIRLKVLNGKSAGRELPVMHEEFLIGRHEECHLRPKSDAISRRHCVIRTREGKVFIEDLGSKNGTVVNGVKLQEETELGPGDVIRLGRLEFEVVAWAQDAAPTSAGEDSASSEAETKQVVQEDSWADDDDITKWLEEEEAKKYLDPATRQLSVDTIDKAVLETAMIDHAAEQTVIGEQPTDSPSQSGEAKEKTEKKKPGKLPPRSTVMGANSREAAADMLKKFFNRP